MSLFIGQMWIAEMCNYGDGHNGGGGERGGGVTGYGVAERKPDYGY